MIYVSARYANEDGTMVQGWDIDGNTETVPFDFAIFRLLEHGPVGFTDNGGIISPYSPASSNISKAPSTLFDGPTLKEIFDGH